MRKYKKSIVMTEDEARSAYYCYVVHNFFVDIDTFIDAEHLSYNEWLEKKGITVEM
jgi:hypothetical protein